MTERAIKCATNVAIRGHGIVFIWVTRTDRETHIYLLSTKVQGTERLHNTNQTKKLVVIFIRKTRAFAVPSFRSNASATTDCQSALPV
jgi:hypothetical protein